MFSFIKSIQSKLLLSHLFFVAIIIVISLQIFWFNNKLSRLTALEGDFNKVAMLNLQVFKTEKVFIQKELSNSKYYQSGKSIYLDQHQSYLRESSRLIRSLKKSKKIIEFGLIRELNYLDSMIDRYDIEFHKILIKVKERGFKDAGLEGYMRSVIHKLEKKYPEFDKVLLLTMRRHEKDYIIRNDLMYVTRLNRLCQYAMHKRFTKNNKKQKQIKTLIKNYLTAFNKLVKYDKEINEGFDYLQNYYFNNLENVTDALVRKSIYKIETENQAISTMLYISLSISLILSIILSYFLSKNITEPIIGLTKSVEYVIKNNFETTDGVILPKSQDEVGILSQKFYYLISNIKVYIEQIKETNSKLEVKNNSLYFLNSDLKSTNDILQRKEEHIQKMNTVKDKFFAILSHDLRGPLTTIKGFLTIMTEHPEAVPEHIKTETLLKLRKSIELQLDLLTNLLEWSSAQVDEIKFNPELLNLKEMADKNIELVAEKANAKDISIANNLDPNLMFYADKNMVNFILRNLISNSLKFTNSKGKISIKSEKDKDFLEVSVIDNGIGISEKSLKYILKPGVHFTTSGTHNEKGTGFGLLLCKEFVEKHDGKIKLKSKEGDGTIVTFSLKINTPKTTQMNEKKEGLLILSS